MPDGHLRGAPRAANPLAATLSRAFAAQQAGHLAEAENHFRTILSVDRKNFGVLHALGMIQGQRGDYAEAEKSLERLAQDRDLLASFQQRLAHNRTSSPLFDTARLTRHIERAYSRMIERHRAGKSPEGFAIERDD